MFTDRDYQVNTVNMLREAIAKGNRKVLLVQPTGAGKGFQAARIMQMCSEMGNSSIFFADQRELIFQIGNQLQRLDIGYSTIMAGVTDEYDSFEDSERGSLCTIAAKDTLYSRAFRTKKIEPPDGKVILIDEAHKSLAKTWKAVAGHYENSIVIGMTATPCRSDGRGLGEFYDCMITPITYRELQDLKYLVPIRVFAPDRPDLKGLKSSRGDYAKGALETRMNRDEMVGSIVGEWRKNADGRSTVVFASGVQHSIHIRNEFRKAGVTCEHIDGKIEQAERDDIMGRARDGSLQIVTNYGVLHTGVDCPRWKYLICARPTKSFSLWRQMCGRIQRPFEGHEFATVQDHSDNCLNFGFPDEDVEWTLDAEVKIQVEHKKKQQEKQQAKDPFACSKCKTVYRGPHCPSCGHTPEKNGKDVKMEKGDLKELKRKELAKKNKNATKVDKQKEWDRCLGLAIGMGRKVGFSAHLYKKTYGVFPRNLEELPAGKSQWGLTAQEFYRTVIKPKRDSEKLEFEKVDF